LTLEELVDLMREFFPKIEVKYETAIDDGKGLVADNTLCRKLLKLTLADPHEGIREYIRRYAK